MPIPYTFVSKILKRHFFDEFDPENRTVTEREIRQLLQCAQDMGFGHLTVNELLEEQDSYSRAA